MEDIKRERGFYWVKEDSEWVVAYYNPSPEFWLVVGSDEVCSERDFEEIDPVKLERQ